MDTDKTPDTKSISSQLSEPSDFPSPSVVSSESSSAISCPPGGRVDEGATSQDAYVGSAPINIVPPQKQTTGFEQIAKVEPLDAPKLAEKLMETGVAATTAAPSQPPAAKVQFKVSTPKVIHPTSPTHKPGRFNEAGTTEPSSGTASPARLPLGSLLSQRLSGMGTPKTGSPASVRSAITPKSPQPDQGYASSPMSQRSFGSSLPMTPEIYRQVRNSEIIGSISSMSSCSTVPEHEASILERHPTPAKSISPPREPPTTLGPTFSQTGSTGTSVPRKSPASFRSFVGNIAVWRSRNILSRHISTDGSTQRVNYVTEAQSVMPSLTSAFSINHVEDIPAAGTAMTIFDLESNQRSVSAQDQLDAIEMLEDPDYIDTVKSNDSAASLLRRSLSVPSRYHYKPQKVHMQDIFNQHPNIPKLTPEMIKKATPAQREKWRQTMDDLLEQPEYLDSLESACSRTGLLATQARIIAQNYGIKVATPTEDVEDTNKQLKFIYFKNLIVLSLGFMFTFISYMSLRNLQSSLYRDGGLGIIALSAIYASLFLGCIFATTIVQCLRPKRTILACMGGIFLYTIANFYPAFYTLVPASAVVGFCMANLWTAHATYMANVAARYAAVMGDKIQNVLSHFNGIFFAFFQTSQVIGGLLSSLVLSPRSNDPPDSSPTSNFTNISASIFPSFLVNLSDKDVGEPRPLPTCGPYYCPYADTNSGAGAPDVDRTLIFILVGIFVTCVIVGSLIILVCMDPLDGVMKKPHSSLVNQLTSVFRFFAQWRVLCLLPLMFYTLLQSSYMFGVYTKAFITCTSGVYMVGYAMVCLSVCSALCAFVSGRLQRNVGRMSLFCLGFSVHIVLILVQILWQPDPSHVVILFVISGCWGLADGIINTQTISLFGVIFADNKEPAFAALKMCQSITVTILFSTSDLFCTSAKLYILLMFATLALTGYLTLELRLRQQNKPKLLAFGPTAV